jgi:PST family polysaccharide transporter
MIIERIKILAVRLFKNKVFENYVSMTSLSVLSTLIGLLLYPYLIRTLGKDSYGLYVFAFSIVCFLKLLVTYGFDYPALKMIVENRNDVVQKNKIMSEVFSAKVLTLLFTTFLLAALCLFVPVIRKNTLLYCIVYLQILSDLFFPQFYFQAMQKMKFVTFINLFCRLLTVPLIFIFIHNEAQTIEYAAIISFSVLLGSAISTYILWKNEGIRLRFMPLKSIKVWFKDAFPFFLTSSMSVFKQESVPVIIGMFFSMADVALYDLANKIVSLLHYLTASINGALYPKILADPQKSLIKKIIRYETYLGLLAIAFVACAGYWIVLVMGGKNMLAAYPLAIILSVLILSRLISGVYNGSVFIQQGRYYFVTRSQIAALFGYFPVIVAGLLLWKNITIVVAALAFSGLTEMFYCNYLTKKYKLL